MVKLWIDQPSVLFDLTNWNLFEGELENKINIMTKSIILISILISIKSKSTNMLRKYAIYIGALMVLYTFVDHNELPDMVNKDSFKNRPVNVAPKGGEVSNSYQIYKDGHEAFYEHNNGTRQFFKIANDQNNFAQTLYSEGFEHSRKEGGLYSHLGLPFNKHSLQMPIEEMTEHTYGTAYQTKNAA